MLIRKIPPEEVFQATETMSKTWEAASTARNKRVIFAIIDIPQEKQY